MAHETKPDKPQWQVPPELAPYARYTDQPTRAEELHNSPATFFNNLPVAVMRAEVQAQWGLLARLHAAGMLKEPEATA